MSEIMAFVAVMATAGYMMRRLGLVEEGAATDLSKIVFYFTLPPLVFLAMHRAELSWAHILMPAIAWSLLLCGLIVCLLLARLLALPRPKAGAWVIVTVFGNSTFLGYPIVHAFYGEPGLALAIFYDLLGAVLVVNTALLVLASRMGTGETARVRDVLRRIALFPPLWGLALGLALRGLELPAPLETLMDTVGALTTPLIMLSVGISLKLAAWREDLGLVAAATVGKLVILPGCLFLALSLLPIPPDMMRVAVLQAAMPTMFFSLTLALMFGLHKTLVVNAIVISTLLSFVTLPLWRLVLGP